MNKIAKPVIPGIEGNLRIYAADNRGGDSGLLCTVHKGRDALNEIVSALNNFDYLVEILEQATKILERGHEYNISQARHRIEVTENARIMLDGLRLQEKINGQTE